MKKHKNVDFQSYCLHSPYHLYPLQNSNDKRVYASNNNNRGEFTAGYYRSKPLSSPEDEKEKEFVSFSVPKRPVSAKSTKSQNKTMINKSNGKQRPISSKLVKSEDGNVNGVYTNGLSPSEEAILEIRASLINLMSETKDQSNANNVNNSSNNNNSVNNVNTNVNTNDEAGVVVTKKDLLKQKQKKELTKESNVSLLPHVNNVERKMKNEIHPLLIENSLFICGLGNKQPQQQQPQPNENTSAEKTLFDATPTSVAFLADLTPNNSSPEKVSEPKPPQHPGILMERRQTNAKDLPLPNQSQLKNSFKKEIRIEVPEDTEPISTPLDDTKESTATTDKKVQTQQMFRQLSLRARQNALSAVPNICDILGTTRRTLRSRSSLANAKIVKPQVVLPNSLSPSNQGVDAEQRQAIWKELNEYVRQSDLAIPINNITITKVFGRGKFASVHQGRFDFKPRDLSVINTPNTNSPTSRKEFPFEIRLSESIQSPSLNRLSIPIALKVSEYANTAPLQECLRCTCDCQADFTSTSTSPTKCAVCQNELAKYSEVPPFKGLQEVYREIVALKALKHQNIVMMHGVILRPRLCIALEYMDRGSLASFLQQEEKLPIINRIQIVKDIANGLYYMHAMHFIHRDLKTHNVLISSGGGGYMAKLCDFGSALYVKSPLDYPEETIGTSGYTAPEVLAPGKYSYPADIFSLAILQWETLALKHMKTSASQITNPLCGLDPEEVLEKIHEGLRPSLELVYPEHLRKIVSSCWSSAAVDRPNMREVKRVYDGIETSGTQQYLDE